MNSAQGGLNINSPGWRE